MQDFLYEALVEQDTLCHHGVLGQKWGIRRYQNKDGSLTEAGRKRYQKIVDRYETDPQRYTKLFGIDEGGFIIDRFRANRSKKANTLLEKDAIRQKVNETYNRNIEDTIKSTGWQTDTWLNGTKSMTKLYTNGRLGKYDVDFATSSGTTNYLQRNLDEALTPDKILQIDATKKRCEKEYKNVLSTIRESVAKQYYDNQPADDSYTLPGMGMTRSGLKDGLIPSHVTISTKNPARIRMDIRNSDGGGLADFLVSYDVDKDKVYDIQYAD